MGETAECGEHVRSAYLMLLIGAVALTHLSDYTPLSLGPDGSRIMDMMDTGLTALVLYILTRQARAFRAIAALARGVLDAAPDGIITIDQGGTILSFNRAAAGVFGYAAGEIIGRPVSVLMGTADAEEHDGHLTRFVRTGEPRVIGLGRELEARCADGTIIPIRLTVSEIQDHRQRLFIGIVRDVSKARLAERVLLREKERAESAVLAKTQFLANVSHEVRTPLNGVLGTAELLAHTKLDPEQAELVGTIETSADALLTLINDILDFSKIEAGKLVIEEVPFDLESVIEQTLKILFAPARGRGVELRAAVDADAPRRFVGDAGRLRQILVNLAGNAVKFTQDGSVDIRVGCDAVVDGGADLCIEVRDTGIGIDSSMLARIFEVFTQADPSTTRRFGGTGLGLAITRQLVELMGGRIEVESEVGRGSLFRVQLRLALDKPRSPEVSPEIVRTLTEGPRKEKPRPLRRGIRVLLAEDNPVNQRVARKLLETLGCAVDLACTGREAIEMLDQARYDIVFMDCQMPDLDGFQATDEIRRESLGGPHLPIVALTADALEESRRRCLAAGMDDFLAKPTSRDALQAVLKRWAS